MNYSYVCSLLLFFVLGRNKKFFFRTKRVWSVSEGHDERKVFICASDGKRFAKAIGFSILSPCSFSISNLNYFTFFGIEKSKFESERKNVENWQTKNILVWATGESWGGNLCKYFLLLYGMNSLIRFNRPHTFSPYFVTERRMKE